MVPVRIEDSGHLCENYDDGESTRINAVFVGDHPMIKLSERTSRSIWCDPQRRIVIKVDRSLAQAQREATAWTRISPLHQPFFSGTLQVGRCKMSGHEYVIQEFVHLRKPSRNKTSPLINKMYDRARALFSRYELWDWQGWRQFGINPQTRAVCIHDYCVDCEDEEYHEWSNTNLMRMFS